MKIFFTTSILLFAFFVSAQQPVQYSMHMLNRFAFNPAYAGMDDALSINGVFRKQWTSLEGSPGSQQLNFQLPLYYLSSGFGMKFEHDEIGAERNLSASLAYSWHIPIGKKGIFSFGASGGLFQKTLDGAKLRTPDGQYNEPFTHNDPILTSITKESANTTVFSAGAYFKTEKFGVGISAENLAESSLQIETTNIKTIRNYYLTCSYTLGEGNTRISPSVLIKSDTRQLQIDFSTLVTYNENIFGGMSLRGYNSNTIDAVVLIGGVKLNNRTSLSYAYDWTLSDINIVSNGSHEIMFYYTLGISKGKLPKVIYNPRYLE